MIMRLAETKVSGVDLKPSFRIGSSRAQATNDRGRNLVGQRKAYRRGGSSTWTCVATAVDQCMEDWSR